MKKRILSLLLAVVMIVGLLPAAALAAGPGGNTRNINFSLGTTENCTIYYIEGNTLSAASAANLQKVTSTNVGQIGKADNYKNTSESYGVMFFVAPDPGYTLSYINATTGTFFNSLMPGTGTDTDCEFVKKYDTPEVGSFKLVQNGVVAGKDGNKGYSESEAKQDTTGKDNVRNLIKAVMDKSKTDDLNLQGVFFYSMPVGWENGITSSLSYSAEKLPTLEKTIEKIERDGETLYTYSPQYPTPGTDIKVTVGDKITYKFTVNFYRRAVQAEKSNDRANYVVYSNIQVNDPMISSEKISGIQKSYQSEWKEGATSETVVHTSSATAEYIVKAGDIDNEKELLTNKASLSYTYQSGYFREEMTAQSEASVSVGAYAAFKYAFVAENGGELPSQVMDFLPKVEGKQEVGKEVTVAGQPQTVDDKTEVSVDGGKWVLVSKNWAATGLTETSVDFGGKFTMPDNTVTLTATWRFVPNGASLMIEKNIAGDLISAQFEWSNLTISVVKLDDEGEETTTTYPLTQGTSPKQAEFTLAGTLPAGTYKVKETGADRTGYDLTMTSLSRISGDITTDRIDSTHLTFTVSDTDTEINLQLTNTYTQQRASGVTKSVVCENDSDKPTSLNTSATITYPTRNGTTINPISVKNGDTVTLLYKITVTGKPGASFKIYEETGANWDLVSSGNFDKNEDVVAAQDKAYIQGWLPATGAGEDGNVTGYFYLTRTFEIGKDDKNGKLSNTITMGNGTSTEEVPVVCPGSFSLANKINKVFTNHNNIPESGNYWFGVNVTEGEYVEGVWTPKAGTSVRTGNIYYNSNNKNDDGAFTFDNSISSITYTEPGTYLYRVNEITDKNDPSTPTIYDDVNYDTSVYELRVVVTRNAETGVLEAVGTFYKLGEDGTWATSGTDTITFTNTYVVYAPAEVDLSTLIKKTLTGKETELSELTDAQKTFTVRLTAGTVEDEGSKWISYTGANASVITGTAVCGNDGATVSFENFTKDGTALTDKKLSLDGPSKNIGAKQYYYLVEEVTPVPAVAGMRYDSHKYILEIVVKRDATKPEYVATSRFYPCVEIDGADYCVWPSEGATISNITFENEYTKPASSAIKNVITSPNYIPVALKDKMSGVEFPTLVSEDKTQLIIDKSVDKVTLAYVVYVHGDIGAYATVSDRGAAYVDYEIDNGDALVTGGWGDGVMIQFLDDNTTVALYYTKTFTRANEDFPGTVSNTAIVNGDTENPIESEETEIKDKTPGGYDFSDIILKDLYVTGDQNFPESLTFRAELTLKEFMNSGVMPSSYSLDEDDPTEQDKNDTVIEAFPDGLNGWEQTLYATFYPDDVTFDAHNTTSFTAQDGSHLYFTFPAEGRYTFTLEEIDDKEDGVKYDANVYEIVVYVFTYTTTENEKVLRVAQISLYKVIDGKEKWFNEDEITFYNEVDTGEIPYYPIIPILPTVKDDGKLNKTDHFAYVIGYPDGTVHPNGEITRAEVATIFFRLLKDDVRNAYFTSYNTYSDVSYGKWYNNPISTMSALGIINGYPDGTFRPDAPITRAEFAAIAARFDETATRGTTTFTDVYGHWAADEIAKAYGNDWIKGYPDGTFRPDRNITRAEAMALINRVLDRAPESPSDLLPDMNKWSDNMDTSKWYYLDIQEATNSHDYTRKTFNYELWKRMLTDPDWSRYER